MMSMPFTMSKNLLLRFGKRIPVFPSLYSSSMTFNSGVFGRWSGRRPYAIYVPPTPNPDPIAYKLSSGKGKGSSPDGMGGPLGYPPTYNELPIPSGSWNAAYTKNNSKYNRMLLLGLSIFVGTIINVRRVVFFNASIPSLGDEDLIDLCPEPKCPPEIVPPKCEPGPPKCGDPEPAPETPPPAAAECECPPTEPTPTC